VTPSRRSIAGRLAIAAAVVLAVMLTVGVVLIHVLAHGWVGRVDDSIERSLLAGRSPFWNTMSAAGTQLAQPLPIAIALVLLVIALAIGTRRAAAPLFLAVTVGIESGIYFVTSTLEPRPRPSIPRLGAADPTASYPSGHLAAAICFYGGLAVLAWVLTDRRWLRWTLTLLAVIVPPAVGLCRMYRGFHHLSDVLAGALLGLLWLTVTTRFLLLPLVARRREKAVGAAKPTAQPEVARRVTPTPMARR
jgi:membrane-associated phospholipid phosphatase